jgi:hypothetical protein
MNSVMCGNWHTTRNRRMRGIRYKEYNDLRISPKLMPNTQSQIQDAQSISYRINAKKLTPRHINFKV